MEYANISPPGTLARVRHRSADGSTLYLELVNGRTSTVTGAADLDLPVGTVVLIDEEEDRIEQAPDDLWPSEPWVGVVRLRLDDVTVVDQSGRLHLLDTSEVQYREGNTVEADQHAGVLRVLDEKPIRFLEVPGIDDAVIAGFKTPKGADGPTFDDFGGLKHVVRRAQELIELPLEHKNALATIGARPIKGVLFTGPPGTGKTMLARIIAGQAGATFYEISGPEVFSKWYGESEEILRRIFEDAAKEDSSIIFFDEIDSVAGHRDEGAHEVSRRVVAQLLTLMDGFKPDDNVVVVATTNRPQDIDVALRRPGRFDWEIDFTLPTVEDREEILRVSAKGLQTDDPLPHDEIAKRTEGWSSAHLAAIWSEAALLAVADQRSRIMSEDYRGGYGRVAEQRQRSRAREAAREDGE